MQIKMTKSFSNYLILSIISLFLALTASIFNVTYLHLDMEWIGTFPNREAFFFLVHNRWVGYLGILFNGLTWSFAYKCYELLKKGKAFEISNDSNLPQR